MVPLDRWDRFSWIGNPREDITAWTDESPGDRMRGTTPVESPRPSQHGDRPDIVGPCSTGAGLDNANPST